MPLILQPVFSELSRDEIELHLLQVRARRMAAVAVYYAGANAKTHHTMIKHQQRMAREYAALAREIEKMNKLEVSIEDRLAKLEIHLQEYRSAEQQLVEIPDGN